MQLRAMAQRAQERGLRLSFGDGLATWIAARCRREDSGARSIRRLIRNEVEPLLAERLLEESAPGAYRVDADENGVYLREAAQAGG